MNTEKGPLEGHFSYCVLIPQSCLSPLMVDVCKSQRNIFSHPRLANLLHLKSKQLHSGVKRQPSHSGPEMNSTPTKEEGITGLMTQGGLEKCQGKHL